VCRDRSAERSERVGPRRAPRPGFLPLPVSFPREPRSASAYLIGWPLTGIRLPHGLPHNPWTIATPLARWRRPSRPGCCGAQFSACCDREIRSAPERDRDNPPRIPGSRAQPRPGAARSSPSAIGTLDIAGTVVPAAFSPPARWPSTAMGVSTEGGRVHGQRRPRRSARAPKTHVTQASGGAPAELHARPRPPYAWTDNRRIRLRPQPSTDVAEYRHRSVTASFNTGIVR